MHSALFHNLFSVPNLQPMIAISTKKRVNARDMFAGNAKSATYTELEIEPLRERKPRPWNAKAEGN